MKLRIQILLLLSVFLLIPLRANAKISVYSQGIFVSVLMGPKDIQELGEKAAVHIEKENKVVKDSLLQKRVDAAAKAVDADYKHPVKILNSQEVNAFCTFDGRIYVSTGLLKLATDDELCFVLAHEVAHSVNGDPEEAFKNQLKTEIALANADVEGVVPTLLLKVGEASYSRDQERLADSEAVTKLFRARRNHKAAITLLQKLGKLHPGSKGLSRYFASHPSAERRIELVSQKIAAYTETQRLSKEMGSRVKIVDPTPFLSAFEKKPVPGYVYWGFGKGSRFYVFHKGTGKIQEKHRRVTLPQDVEEVIIVFRNPKPGKWLDGLISIEPDFVRVLFDPKNQSPPALAIKLPAPLVLSGKIHLFGSYGYDAVLVEKTTRFAFEFADIQFTR